MLTHRFPVEHVFPERSRKLYTRPPECVRLARLCGPNRHAVLPWGDGLLGTFQAWQPRIMVRSLTQVSHHDPACLNRNTLMSKHRGLMRRNVTERTEENNTCRSVKGCRVINLHGGGGCWNNRTFWNLGKDLESQRAVVVILTTLTSRNKYAALSFRGLRFLWKQNAMYTP